VRDLDAQYNITVPEDPLTPPSEDSSSISWGFIPKAERGFEYGNFRFSVVEWMESASPGSKFSVFEGRRRKEASESQNASRPPKIRNSGA